MYLAIDIGGTKTLLAIFNAKGDVTEEEKFETPKEYQEFIKILQQKVKEKAEKSPIYNSQYRNRYGLYC
jgi:predicted NBD/HSP70 family sugar kinase